MNRNIRVVKIDTSLSTYFFRYYLQFLHPLHKLTNTEMNVFSLILRERHNLSLMINNEELIQKVLWSEDTRKKIGEESGLSYSHFHVIIGSLKKKGVIGENGVLNNKFIPRVNNDADNFRLIIHFDLNNGTEDTPPNT